MDFKKFKTIIRYLIPIIAILGYSLFLYFTEGKENIIRVFSSLSLKHTIAAFVVYFGGVLFSDLSLYFSRKHYQKHFPFYYVIYNNRSAEFFEILTPGTFAFGPIIHINNMAKQGLPPSKGVVLILVRQIASMISGTIFVLCSLFFNFHFFWTRMSYWLWFFFIVALVMQLATGLFYLFAPRQDRIIMKIVNYCLNLLCKLHLMKEARREKIVVRTEDQIVKLKDNMKGLDYTVFEWCRMILCCFIANIFGNSVNYFSARALHIATNGGALLVMAAINMAGTISGQVAIIPGGLGIQELCYTAFLLPVIGSKSELVYILLFNRIIGYYLPLIIGGIFQFIPKPKLTKHTDIVEGFFVPKEEESSEQSDPEAKSL